MTCCDISIQWSTDGIFWNDAYDGTTGCGSPQYVLTSINSPSISGNTYFRTISKCCPNNRLTCSQCTDEYVYTTGDTFTYVGIPLPYTCIDTCMTGGVYKPILP